MEETWTARVVDRMKTYMGHISFSFEIETELTEQEAWERVVGLISRDEGIYTDFHDGEIWEEKDEMAK